MRNSFANSARAELHDALRFRCGSARGLLHLGFRVCGGSSRHGSCLKQNLSIHERRIPPPSTAAEAKNGKRFISIGRKREKVFPFRSISIFLTLNQNQSPPKFSHCRARMRGSRALSWTENLWPSRGSMTSSEVGAAIICARTGEYWHETFVMQCFDTISKRCGIF